MMRSGEPLDVSVIVPFVDHEDQIGTLCRRVSEHLRSLDLRFEIVAVDEGAGDNSRALLTLLRERMPELSIESASGAGRGYATGATRARAKYLWLVEPTATKGVLATFNRALARVVDGDTDAFIVNGRFAVLRRTRCLPLLSGTSRNDFQKLARRARSRGVSVETYDAGGQAAGIASQLRLTSLWKAAARLGPPMAARNR